MRDGQHEGLSAQTPGGAQPAGEGVIRFELDFRQTSPEGCLLASMPFLPGLDGWRSVLWRLGLIGRDPQRYEGYGFGNLSHRLVGVSGAEAAEFVVSGTQTGEHESLGTDGWSLVKAWDLDRFQLRAEGPAPPSSESLTHALLYDIEPDVHCVVHVHCPEIWHAAQRLDLLRTGPDVQYGSREMLRAVRDLFALGLGDIGLFAMAGHEDGIVAFGADADDACGRLLTYLSRALAPA